ncbi:MAG: metallophosphoesterase [Myxococcota bacterium]
MRIAWLTDVHLDHVDALDVDRLSRQVAATRPDAVVLTGDISVAPRLGEDLERLLGAFRAPVYLVAGNHDYWGADVATVRTFLTRVRDVVPRLRWLGVEEPIVLDDERALVGVDGWADARLGDAERSPLRLADYHHIADLKGDFDAAVGRARALADADAVQLGEQLERALRLRPHVYVATHFPPFAEAARYQGRITSGAFLPWVTSKAIGDALLEQADRHPTRRITVLCGHMHHPAHVWMRPNLEVRTGAAEYGAPRVGDVIVLEGGD